MLSKDGYCSIYKMYLYAEHSIYSAMRSTIQAERAKTAQRPPWSHMGFNVDIASRYLVYDVINRAYGERGGSLSIMRPDGGLINMSPMLINPVNQMHLEDRFYEGLKAARKEGGITRNDHGFALSYLKYDFWHLPFMEDEIFMERHISLRSVTKMISSEIPIIDWATSSIDLSKARTFLTGIDQLRSAYQTLKTVGFSITKKTDEYLDEGWDHDLWNVVKLLTPYEGCTVVVPVDWLRFFDPFLTRPEREDAEADGAGRDPRGMIRAIVLSDEPFTKATVRSRVLDAFPNMAGRRFEQHWAAIAEDIPSLGKPGRKPSKRTSPE